MVQKTLIIIPAYNEEENIEKVIKSIRNYNDENKTKYDVVVINDASKDRTLEICLKNNVTTISLIHNLGIGGAVQTGFKYARDNHYDIAVQFDGDGQHDVSCIDTIIEPICKGEADFVIGSRFVDSNSSEFKSSKARRVGINIISFFIKLATKKRVLDTTSGFRAINKEIINYFATNYPVEYPEPITNAELLRMGYQLKEVPVRMHERIGGESSIRAWKNIYYMINVILTIFTVRLRRYHNDK